MENIIKWIQAMLTVLGGIIGMFFGGLDGFFIALLVFVALDYFTGILLATSTKTLSSEVGFKGIAKKVCIFFLVGVGNVIDTLVLKEGTVIRTAVIFFYLSNEGISIVENMAALGLPIPQKIKDVLAQLNSDKKK